jgi:hypothetical protein
MSSEGARVEKVNGFVVQLPQGTPKKLANDVPSLQVQVEELTKRVAQEESKRISAEQVLHYAKKDLDFTRTFSMFLMYVFDFASEISDVGIHSIATEVA